jgi:uncharacterized hydrophobic protein (TIGR00271 family)
MAADAQALTSPAAVRATIDSNSVFDAAYVTMNVLATVVACYGLFENSSAVVIGAMVIAMLLGPILGVSMGLVDANNPLLGKAVASLAGGVAVVFGTAFIVGLVHSEFPLTDQIYARTAPNLMDLMIALGGGAAGAYSMISPRLSVAFVGVAISTALVPPLSASGICIARGDYHLGFGALLLTFTNIVGIEVAASVVMWFGGYRGIKAAHVTLGTELKRNILTVSVSCILAVLLSLSLQEQTRNELYKVSVRKVLTAAASDHKGAYLTDIRVEQSSGHMLVVAVYRTPLPFTPEEVRAIEPRLPLMLGVRTLELRIRSVPVTVTSKGGYLYSGEDLKDHDLEH